MADPTTYFGSEGVPLDAPSVEPPKVSGRAELDALAPGSDFIDPNGVKRTKPYTVTDAASLRAVPDGATFIDPNGQARVKPAYEPLDFVDQIMVDMTRGNERQIEAILTGQYGKENIKREPLTGELYIEKDGRRMKPNRGSILRRGLAVTAADIAPVTVSTVGAILGGTGGSLVPFAGTAAGGVGGAVIGGAAGEAFNQAILGLAGYGTTPGEYLEAVGKEAIFSGGGQAAGGIIGQGVSGVIGKTGAARDVLKDSGSMVARLLGAQPAETAEAKRLSEKGVMVPPSAWLKEAPYLRKVVETFDPEFRRQNVLSQSAKAYYESEVPKVLEQMGVKAPASLTDATAPVSVEPFGAAMLTRAQTRLAAKDAQLDAAVIAAREQVARRGGAAAADPVARQATLDSLSLAEQQARTAAQDVVDTGFKSIQADVDNTIKLAGAGENPGDMVRLADEKVRALRKAVSERARKLYGAADAAAGEARPDVTMLRAEADEFLAQVPEDFKNRYPAIIRAIAEMNKDVTFGQLHQLRSMLRQDIDYADLTPGVRQGALAAFVNKINGVLFDEGAPPELKAAADLLRKADDFYANNIRKFKTQSAKWIAQQLEAGVPADSEALARQLFQPGQTEEMRTIRKVIGKPLWTAVQAADTRAMLAQSKTLVPGEIDGLRFAEQVLQRDRDGILTAAYDPAMAETLRAQAQRVSMLAGKLPLEARPGDTVATLLRRADALTAEIKAAAEVDPVKLLNDELRRFDRGVRQIKADYLRQRRQNPLYFLENQSAGAIEAANKILGAPDKMIAVARQFGEQSPEFEMLRQVWATRLFQRSVPDTGKLTAEFSGKIPPEIQQMMFPGVSLDSARALAKDMQFLMPSVEPDTGGSMAAASRVLNPIPKLPLDLQRVIERIPGANTAARAMLNFYYSTMTWAVTHPAFVRYVAAGLQSGDAEMRNLARREFMQSYGDWLRQTGGAIGAGFGATAGSGESTPSPPMQAPPMKSWREVYRERYGKGQP